MITRTPATVRAVTDLSPTAREVVLMPETPFSFSAGAFVNVFVPSPEGPVRRAYSLSSDPNDASTITLTMRHIPTGAVSPFFWHPDVVGSTIDLMGPLGVNTADKLTRAHIFLVGFGIGVSVIKSLTHVLSTASTVTELTIITGVRNEDEHLYADFFTTCALNHPQVTVRTVFSHPRHTSADTRTGYAHSHLDGFDFSDADVYLCGQPAACQAFQERVACLGARNVQYHIESF